MVNGNSIVGRGERREIAGPNPLVQCRLDQPGDGAEPDFLADERSHKAANLEEIANVERSHAALNDPQPVSPSSSKRKKGAA